MSHSLSLFAIYFSLFIFDFTFYFTFIFAVWLGGGAGEIENRKTK